jgi:hypothetical protein
MKFTLISLIIALSALTAEIPSMINYQGILTNDNGTVVNDGNYNLSFSIYDAASGGSALWSETHSGVEVTQGLFNIMLGSVTPLDIPFDMQYYLEIAVDGDIMTDRIAFSSTAYSLNARAVNGNQGIPSGGIIMWSGSEIPDGWALCDGANGSPDLRDRFIVGAGGTNYTIGDIGGSSTHGHNDNFSVADHVLTVAEMPSHNHSIDPGLELRVVDGDGDSGNISGVREIVQITNYTGGGQPHDHGLNGGVANGDNIPPYYALAFIIKL